VAAELEFCLLGPLLVRRGGAAIPIPSGKQQALLAALLLNANKVVLVDELAEVLWGSAPPPSARASLQTYVMRLRKTLADDGHCLISAQADGYLIDVRPGELDVGVFESSLADARQAMRAGAHAQASAQLRAALSLWRGQPLAGVPSQMLALREVPRLAEMWSQAVEVRIDADLHLGRHSDVISELKNLAAANPLRERLHAMLMLALYRDGQQASALDAYQAARSVLVAELGTEPGPELRQLQQQVLTADPALAAPGPAGVSDSHPGPAGADPWPRRDPVVPRQLPSEVPYFTGRAAELAALGRVLDQAAQTGGAVVISAIAGTAGIGKTALAVHWAHQVADRFPDGQLYLNLRGFGPSGTMMTPAQAVRLVLGGLGVPPKLAPAQLDAAAALYRSLLAGKRMLIVLDNARDPAQVRPLLPGAPGCLVLVTSREQLSGLAAADGAHLLTLGVPTEAEAREMLARRLGQQRAEAEPAAATELTGLCARLPLALSIAAARAAARPGLPLAALAAELRDTLTRLDGLDTGDAATDMRTVFSWSCQQLTRPAARMFRLLGLHPGPDITARAAASLAGVPLSQARQLLAELARAHLITEHPPGRYACHDLLRAYAAEQARSYSSDASRRTALHRALDHYLHSAAAASRLLHPWLDEVTLDPPQPQVQPEEPADRQQALAWFQAERQVLQAAMVLAAAAGFDQHAWQLPWSAAEFLAWHGYWHELAAAQQDALTAARRLGDLAGQVHAHRWLGVAQVRLGAYAEGMTNQAAALELGRQLGSSYIQAEAYSRMAWTLALQGRFRDALGHCEESLRLFRAAGERSGEAIALNDLGWYHASLGNYQEALNFCRQALAQCRELGDSIGEAVTLDSLGYAYHHTGDHGQAITCYQRAIDLYGDACDPHDRAEMLTHLGDAHDASGNPADARHAWDQAAGILDYLHDPGAGKLRSRLGRHPDDGG
jgi:DNA-binding SARP family transcriptional activator/Tfp pilus assembly protein PilF